MSGRLSDASTCEGARRLSLTLRAPSLGAAHQHPPPPIGRRVADGAEKRLVGWILSQRAHSKKPPPARFCSTVNSRVIDAVSTRRHAVPMARFLNDQPAPSVQTGSLREADAANPNPGGLSLRKLPVCRHAPVTRLVSGAPGKAPRQSRIFRIASGATRTPSERCHFKSCVTTAAASSHSSRSATIGSSAAARRAGP